MRLRFTAIFLIFLAFLNFNFAQDYEMSIENGQQVDSKTFSFEVFIAPKAPTTTFNLTAYQGALTFNLGIVNGGMLAFSYENASSALGNPPIAGVGINDDGGTKEFTFGSSFQFDVISSKVKVGKFIIENGVDFGAVTPDIVWNFDDTFKSAVFTTGGAPITNPSNHTNLDYSTPLPVELSSFSVNAVEGIKAQLQWETATEINNYGFEIERSVISESAVKVEDEEVELKWEMVAFIEGHGNSNSIKSYTFTDKDLVGGSKFKYRLKQIDIDGTFEYSDAIEVEVLPTKYELLQNYPNPFNPVTNIKFSLPENAKIAINIYNILGEKVTTLLNEELNAGFHQVNFNTNSAGYQLASGMYLYTIESKNFSQVKKMILMK